MNHQVGNCIASCTIVLSNTKGNYKHKLPQRSLHANKQCVAVNELCWFTPGFLTLNHGAHFVIVTSAHCNASTPIGENKPYIMDLPIATLEPSIHNPIESRERTRPGSSRFDQSPLVAEASFATRAVQLTGGTSGTFKLSYMVMLLILHGSYFRPLAAIYV